MREIVIGLTHYCLFLFMGVALSITMPTQSPDFELVWACRLIAFCFGCYSAMHVVDYTWRYENGWTEVKVLLAMLFVILVAAQAYWLFA